MKKKKKNNLQLAAEAAEGMEILSYPFVDRIYVEATGGIWWCYVEWCYDSENAISGNAEHLPFEGVLHHVTYHFEFNAYEEDPHEFTVRRLRDALELAVSVLAVYLENKGIFAYERGELEKDRLEVVINGAKSLAGVKGMRGR